MATSKTFKVWNRIFRRSAARHRNGRPRPSDAFRESTYPPPYPDGWYRVAASADINRGEAMFVECLGQQIALFRSALDGQVHAIDAFCPHMGANLAHGQVIADQLRCPFHGWRIDGGGQVRCIPTNDKLPAKVHPHWDVIDYYGMVVIYHAEHMPNRVLYRLPAQSKLDSGQFVYRGRHNGGEVGMHLIEFAENAVDFQHFPEIHGVMHIPWTRFRIPFIKIHHQASWEPDANAAHLAYFKDQSMLEIFGRVMPKTGASAKITFHGPGGIVQFDFSIPNLGEITMFQTHTPIAPLKQQVHFSWFADKSISRILASYVVGNWVSQWRRDVDIWENKIYRQKPLLTKSDGPVHRMRQWYQQFYAK